MKLLLAIFFLLGHSIQLFAQQHTFPEVKEILFMETPQSANTQLRKTCFGNIDDILISASPILTEDIRLSYTSMITKAIYEINAEHVSDGITVWQIFNHGFVVKTPTLTFAFDLKDYYKTEEFLQLANLIDVYFISHEHKDHSSPELIATMKSMGKPVIGCEEWDTPSIGMNAGESLTIGGLLVTAHYGLHSVPVRQFEVVTSEGIRILHTGDNQTSETLPDIENIDVLLINSWINESGATSSTEGVRIAVNKLAPQVTLPGHIMELWHLVNGWSPVSYRDAIASDNGTLASEYQVLAWGERYQYDISSPDLTLPNPVQFLDFKVVGDSTVISWDSPLPATDGDTASFYRVNINNTKDYYVDINRLQVGSNDLVQATLSIYAYDNSGNQSLPSSEIITSIYDEKDYANLFASYQNYPNPFGSTTNLNFDIPIDMHVTIEIINNSGATVRQLLAREVEKGVHRLTWDGLDNRGFRLPGGVYFAKMQFDQHTMVRKLVMLNQ